MKSSTRRWRDGPCRGMVRIPGIRVVAGAMGLLLLLVFCGCGSKPEGIVIVNEVVEPPVDPCMILPGPADRSGVIEVALTEEVLPANAPDPHNDAERLLFRQLYETLVRVDCQGKIHAGLAVKWTRAESGRRWTFTLRPNARFSDGSPVRAGEVRRAWLASRDRAVGEGRTFPWACIESVSELGSEGGTITVLLTEHQKDPLLFAHPALAIAQACTMSDWTAGAGALNRRTDAGSLDWPAGATSVDWPAGTGPLAISTDYAPPGDPWDGETVVCVTNPHHTNPGQSHPHPSAGASSHPRAADGKREMEIWFRIHGGADSRDMLDAGMDAVLVMDRVVLDYAAGLPNYISLALPWDRVYVIASQVLRDKKEAQDIRASARCRTTWSEMALPDFLRKELAREVVESVARPACSFSFAGQDVGDDCAVGHGSTARIPDQEEHPVRLIGGGDSYDLLPPRMLYPAGDEDARRIAGRFVYLSSLNQISPESPVAVEISPLLRLLFGEDRQTGPVTDGVAPEMLRESLEHKDNVVCIVPLRPSLLDNYPEREIVRGSIPLIATRPHLVCRRELAGVRMDWDGTLLFDESGWRTSSTAPSGQPAAQAATP
ncbi:MAG: hypothetical protein KAY24_14550 [Candidatus Eisenbacteria sp.]|nr:hypothetical protein [Candidatus Eisenbacteria bacterium]